MTKPKRYKRFSSEFKCEAIMRASEEEMTDKAVCDELGVSTRQFRRWRHELALLLVSRGYRLARRLSWPGRWSWLSRTDLPV